MWNDRVLSGEVSLYTYNYIRKEMLMNFIVYHNYKFLVRLKKTCNVSEEAFECNGCSIDNAWSILFHYYGKCWYFYYSLLLLPYLGLKDAVKYGLKCMGWRK